MNYQQYVPFTYNGTIMQSLSHWFVSVSMQSQEVETFPTVLLGQMWNLELDQDQTKGFAAHCCKGASTEFCIYVSVVK